MAVSVHCNEEEYRLAVEEYDLIPDEISGKMSGQVRSESMLDDDLSWEQLFSKKAEIDPDMEIAERSARIAASAEHAGKALAREVCKSLDVMIHEYRSRLGYGYEFVFRLLYEYYVPALSAERTRLVSECERMRRKETEMAADLRISAEETRSASRIGGDREAKTLAYLEAVDDYFFFIRKEKKYENLIRVMSTMISFCEKTIPEDGSRPEPPRPREEKMSFPRRCTITTDDGQSFSVEVSDGSKRHFAADQSLEDALETVKNLMRK